MPHVLNGLKRYPERIETIYELLVIVSDNLKDSGGLIGPLKKRSSVCITRLTLWPGSRRTASRHATTSGTGPHEYSHRTA